MSGVALLTIFVLSIFVGFEVVSKVSAVLHTPLMSGANAIHGVVLIGAIIVTGSATTTLPLILGLLAIVLAIIVMSITNVMTISVIERTREIGTLRAIGSAVTVTPPTP